MSLDCVHYLYNFRNGLYVFLRFSIQLYVSDMPSAGNGVESCGTIAR